MIRFRTVSSGFLRTSTSRLPRWLMVPAKTEEPTATSTGMDSPVMGDWSTLELPWTTTPSAGILSPGRTTTRSPTRRASMGTRTHSPPRRTRAAVGRSAMRAVMALRVRPMA